MRCQPRVTTLLLYHESSDDVRAGKRKSRVFSACDGIIFIGQRDQHEKLNELATAGKPMVVWGADLPDRQYCLVGGNDELGGYMATKHLLNLGCKHVAFFR